MATQVKDNGGMEYRLSSNGLIEYYDHGCKVWCNYTIISDAEDLLLHHGRLAYKNKKGDVYLTGNDVVVNDIIDGNLFVFANSVTINSQIGGDAFILAKKLIIDEVDRYDKGIKGDTTQ